MESLEKAGESLAKSYEKKAVFDIEMIINILTLMYPFSLIP